MNRETPRQPSPTSNEKKSSLEGLEVISASATIAKERPKGGVNEDSFLEQPEKGLFGVFDGIGGHKAGERASSLARDKFAEAFGELSADKPQAVPQVVETARQAFQKVNREIYEEGVRDPKLRGMGTTASLIKLFRNEEGSQSLLLGHVGDSRGYLVRDGKLQLLTEDDSFLKEARERGMITPERARDIAKKMDTVTNFDDLAPDEQMFYGQRHILRKSLGTTPDIEPALSVVPVKSGDRYFLLSDGVSDVLTRDRIQEIVTTAPSLSEALRIMTEEASRVGAEDPTRNIRAKGGDDATAVGIEIQILEKPPKLYPKEKEAIAEDVFKKIVGDRQMKGIIAELSGKDLNSRDLLASRDVLTVLERYPDLEGASLAKAGESLLRRIALSNGLEKRKEYERSFARLKETMREESFMTEIEKTIQEAQKREARAWLIFTKIEDDRQIRGIIAELIRKTGKDGKTGFNARDEVSHLDVYEFLEQFPTLVSLQNRKDAFLLGINKKEEYRIAFDRLYSLVYPSGSNRES